MQLIAGLLIPFAGTALGSAMVFFMRGMHKEIERLLLGFASGVMIAASVWSLLIPAIDMAGDGKWRGSRGRLHGCRQPEAFWAAWLFSLCWTV